MQSPGSGHKVIPTIFLSNWIFIFFIFSVLYFSWHRYEHQEFWPSLKESDYDAVGLGEGKGFNINLPWNKVNIIFSTTKQVQ